MTSSRTLQVKSNLELRLFAVLSGGALVAALVLSEGTRLSAESLFPRALFGFISSLALGLPLLLLGDRRWPMSRTRHLANGMVQSLVLYLFFGSFSLSLFKSAVLGGIALGAWYALVLPWVERLNGREGAPAGRSWRSVMALPLAGGLVVGSVASVYFFFAQASVLPIFFLFFVSGALLSMLVCWPVLWLVERFLKTAWRYVIGGAGSGLLMWLMFTGSVFVEKSTTVLLPAFWLGLGAFALIGSIAGLLYTAFVWKQLRADS
ncbi:hypothetical protein [Pseudomonas vanderleydeniana]|uniref:Uncharacterized protein n=1 Tax=Pseudomonas vanderleydeniana TaxID=2745495 RepID=A0A9E6TUC3_9PSED|nr:hypothetical protein [Pseudomonas vanderleydeniana]QXI30704.1 hypothetical protein HU752_012485 [Pseudomonas vanderleydeniana]